MRKKLIAGNLKMNLSLHDITLLTRAVAAFAPQVPAAVQVLLCPTFVHIAAAKRVAGRKVKIGAQDCSEHLKGAYTGQISAAMLQELKCDYVIVGHSERRQYQHENDTQLAAKIKTALSQGLKVIYCCGEVLEERKRNEHFKVVSRQIQTALSGFSGEDLQSVVIAYEPVWAIGTGETATPQQAQEMHAFIRKEVAKLAGAAAARRMLILYGGSVKPSNARELFTQADVDGGLIGGAALVADDFIAIIQAAC